VCRSIQQLRGAQPPATDAEIRDAALQYVRKISGYRTPSQANQAAFESAVERHRRRDHATARRPRGDARLASGHAGPAAHPRIGAAVSWTISA
jgi:hypothetical protein